MKTINILFAVNDDYVDQLKVMIYSLHQQNKGKMLAIYNLQKQLLERHQEIENFCQRLNIHYYPVVMGDDAFSDAPTTDRYPETIYYRLLAHEYLPVDLEKILYVDADILTLNGFTSLYEMDLGDSLYAAASHVADSRILDMVNKLRLKNFENESYYNTGVMLLNLVAIRQTVKREDIMTYIIENGANLILPDQDILNALYGHLTLSIPDQIYNYDARYNVLYYARSNGLWNLEWVMEHTVFLHFCGRDKPWKSDYRSRYSGLYKHYQQLVKQIEAK
ncbi:glycosyltransferase family 8 protein [Streptococcus sp. X16XC17]|uniref:glycosyltransferase family 8 protein n=1 Tax=unclassified Streptococcus TaxID=2608887 RepID=UPI00066FCF3B|nr:MULTISPECIES: glycosyltransferase family 8 protein [unclassified Streptococcus]TCD46086.1 glycosyltransferase family 8 protein [Streptococcus sp. X16XC17]